MQPVDKTLRFNQKGEFTILQMTDLHYGEKEDRDKKNEAIQEKLIKYTNPDIVVLTGDMISGYAWNKKDGDFFQKQWRRLTKVFLDEKILYAYALGNHDHEANHNYYQIADLDMTHPYSLFKKGEVEDEESASNYLLPLYSNIEGRQNEITANLWILDSKSTGCEEIKKSYACFSKTQEDWVIQKQKDVELQQNKKINSLVFFHIPPQEMMYMWNENPTVGIKGENVCCPKKNTGTFQILKNYANAKGIYVGHDHDNDYKGFYQGVELAYGRKTGYGSYGPKKMQKGGNVIKLKEKINEDGKTDFDVNSYIVQEDGIIIDDKNYKWQGNKMKQTKGAF